MPNIRRLKKDINYLIFEVISDCFTFGSLHPDDYAEEVSSILSDAVSLRNNLIKRVNSHGPNDDPKATKAHYQEVTKDLYVEVDKLCKRLSAIPGRDK